MNPCCNQENESKLMDLTVKQYDDTWDYDEAFKEWGDTKNCWIKVSYLIHRNYFVPGEEMEYHPLTDIVAENGHRIFEGANIDISKYELIEVSKDFEDDDQSIYRVTEYYGFITKEKYIIPTRTLWQRPGIYDEETGAVTRICGFGGTNALHRSHTINVDNSDGIFAPGNKVSFRKDYYTTGLQWWWPQSSDPISILAVTATTIIVPEFTWYINSPEGTAGSVPSGSPQGGFFQPGTCWVFQIANVRPAEEDIFTAEMHVSFFKYELGKFPILKSRDVPKLAGERTDTLSSASEPTLAVYNSRIGTFDEHGNPWRLRVTQEDARPWRGKLWIKESLLLPYQ